MTESLKQHREKISELPESTDFCAIKTLFKASETADVGNAISDAPLTDSTTLFRLIPNARRARVFSYLNPDVQELLKELPEGVVNPLVNEMEPDDRTWPGQ